MKHVYISPHADDVALSCGGQIIANAAIRGETLVVTVFTSQITDADAGDAATPLFDSLNRSRDLEDHAAWASLGITAHYSELPEALLRKRFPFKLFKEKSDTDIIQRLYQSLRRIVDLYPDAVFYFPAAFGNHIDHLLCTKMAFLLLDQGVLDKIVLYEDIPYCWFTFVRQPYYRSLLSGVAVNTASREHAARAGGLGILAYLAGSMVPFPRGKLLFAALAAALAVERLRPRRSADRKRYSGTVTLTRLDPGIMAAKQALLWHYATQLPMLFGADPERLLDACRASFSTETTIEVTRM